jgi:hypothetical protein
MNHFFDAITDAKGNALTGYYVRVTDAAGNGQSLYADASLTPIISVSGLADAAQVDTNGNVDFFINVGTYTVNIYATDGTTLVKSVTNVPMVVDTTGLYGAAGELVQIASRSALAAITPTANLVRYLTESGREGEFVFDSSNHSAHVTADAAQAIYVAPSSDTTGASGAWVRKFTCAMAPEWFGAKGDGTTDDYAAFVALAAMLSGTVGGAVRFANKKTYYIGQHHTAANGVTFLTFQNAAGLTMDGNGSILSFDGAFDRSVSTTAGIGTAFVACSDLKIMNLELDGNVDQTTNSSGSVESAFSYGIQINGCTDVTLENIYTHHFATDGLIIGSASGIASKRVKCTNVRSKYNARQGLTLDAFERVTFENCEFTDQGRAAGTYGHHAPTNGLDIEPSHDLSFAGGLDVDSNNCHFINCKFANNLGAEISGVLDRSAHTATFVNCRVEAAADAASTASIVIGLPRSKFKNCYIDVSSHRMELAPGSGNTATHVIEGCEIRGTAASANTLYSALASVDTVIRNNRIICTATSVLTNNFIALTQASVTFRNNYVFIPSATYSDAGVGDSNTIASVAINNVKESSGNEYATDLLAAAGSSGTAHFYVFNTFGTSRVFNEKFTGTAPGTADTFRPAANSAFDTTNYYGNRNLVVNGGTPITGVVVYSPSITPASVAAATVAEQTFTVTGLTTADKIIVNPPAIANATGIAGARVSAANTLAIRFANPTAGALTPTSGTYTVLALRS